MSVVVDLRVDQQGPQDLDLLADASWEKYKMSEIIIETPRIVLRKITMDDLDAYAEINADPEVRKFYTSGPLQREQAAAEINKMINQYEQYGFSLWATVLKENGRFIGRCGLINQVLPELQDVEVGYMIASDL